MYKAMHQSMRSSEKLAELSDYAYRVWSMGVVASDMVGRISATPRKYRAEAIHILPFEEARVRAAFNEMEALKLVHRYTVDGKPYFVFHDHDDHNKGTKNLRNLKPVCPPPVSNLCFCVAYAQNEENGSSNQGLTPDREQKLKELERRSSAVPTADGTADGSAGVYVPVHVPVSVPVPVQEGVVGGGKAKNGTTEAHIVSAWNRGPGFPISHPAGQKLIKAFIDSGVSPQACEEAVSNQPQCKGRKLWEVLEPLRPTQSPPGVKSISQVLAEFKGGKT